MFEILIGGVLGVGLAAVIKVICGGGVIAGKDNVKTFNEGLKKENKNRDFGNTTLPVDWYK